MKEIVKDIRRWQKQDKKIAVARVIDLDGSGPRLPGAAMAVTEEGEVAGSVSGAVSYTHLTLPTICSV